MTVYVLDANVLIHGRGTLPDGEYWTVPRVQEELESTAAKHTFTAINISVHQPSESAVRRIQQHLGEETDAVSAADQSVLALAWEQDATVLTDDYALQNACRRLAVPYTGFADAGIGEERTPRRLCTTCGESVAAGKERCHCGGTPRLVHIATE